MEKKDDDKARELRDGVEAAKGQPGFQEVAPNVTDNVRTDGERLYEIYQRALTDNGVGSDNYVALSDEMHLDWDQFAKELFKVGAKF